MSKYILSIDLGTTSMKTVLFNQSLKVVASANAEYPTDYPKDGWAEQDPLNWWEAFLITVKDILRDSQVDPENIASIGIDSMSSMALPMGFDNQPLRNGLLWLDRRAEKESQWIKDNHLDLQKKINSNDSDPSNFGPKILWIKNNEPEIYSNTKVFLHCNGYLVYKLTGNYSMDISECGLSQLCDIKEGTWSNTLIDTYQIDRSKLPPIYACTDIVGTINAEAAALSDLAEGTPVIAGAMDNVAACLGLGLKDHGEAYISAGTATNAGACVSQVPSDASMLNYHHAVPGHYLINGGVDFGGAGLRWFKALIEEGDFNKINKMAEEAGYCDDPLLFLPYMVGQRAPLWNTNSRGVAFGMSPDTDRKAMVRMVMEGNAFGVRTIFEKIQEKGFDLDKIVMTGGCANSQIWTQIFSDITDKKIDLPGEMDVAPLGTAMMAGVGVGLYSNFDEVYKQQSIRASYSPDKSKTSYYTDLFKVFKELYKALKPVYQSMADIRTKYQK